MKEGREGERESWSITARDGDRWQRGRDETVRQRRRRSSPGEKGEMMKRRKVWR